MNYFRRVSDQRDSVLQAVITIPFSIFWCVRRAGARLDLLSLRHARWKARNPAHRAPRSAAQPTQVVLRIEKGSDESLLVNSKFPTKGR